MNKTIKLKNLPVENPDYSRGQFWFCAIVAVVCEILVKLDII